MNARERFINTILFKEIDRPFRWEAHFFWTQTVERWNNEGLPKGVKPQIFFGMDPIVWIPVKGGWASNPYTPMFEEEIIAEEGENIIRREQDGVVRKRRKDAFCGTAPQLLEFPVKNMEDFRNILWRLDYSTKERLPENWGEKVKEYIQRDYPLGMFVLGPFGFTRNLLGDEKLMYSIYDDPELLHAIMSHWLEFYKGYIEMVCKDVVPDFVMMWEDMCYVNGPLISPESYKEFMAPYFVEMVSYMKEQGIKGIVVDCDGDMRKMIPVYLDCGINVFFPMEVQSGMDIVSLRKQYGNSFAIIGGLDKNRLALDKVEILDELQSKVPYMLHIGGYIPALDHGCPPNVSFENYCYFNEVVRSMGLNIQ